jgi:hypothetical protein
LNLLSGYNRDAADHYWNLNKRKEIEKKWKK